MLIPSAGVSAVIAPGLNPSESLHSLQKALPNLGSANPCPVEIKSSTNRELPSDHMNELLVSVVPVLPILSIYLGCLFHPAWAAYPMGTAEAFAVAPLQGE